ELKNIGIISDLREVLFLNDKIPRTPPATTFDPAHFFSYGDFSLIFEIVSFVLSPDYNRYLVMPI
ncbi:hypothetical protein OMAG_000513, partial [Candidatus Omnitrophus magneticus]